MPDANRQVYDNYVAELKKENRSLANIRFASGFQWLLVSKDPQKTFSEAADHIIYQANHYTEWLSKAGHLPNPVYLKDRKQLGQSGLLKVVEPDRAIAMIRDFIGAVPVTHYYSWTLPRFTSIPSGWTIVGTWSVCLARAAIATVCCHRKMRPAIT